MRNFKILLGYVLLYFFAIAAVIALCMGTARATELDLVLHGASKHINATGYNERNYGIGLRTSRGNAALQAGQYLNSYNRPTRYVAFEYLPWDFLGGRAGGFIAAATGYPQRAGVTPLAGFTVRWELGRTSATVRAIHTVAAAEIGVRMFKFD